MRRVITTLLLFLLLHTLAAEIPDPLRVALMPNLPPLSFLNADGEPDGAFSRVIGEIARNEGFRIEWIEGSWSENLGRARRGEIDLMSSLIYTQERDDYLDYGSESVISSWSQVFQAKEGIVDTIFDLEGKRVGLVHGDQNARGFVALAGSFNINYEALYFDSFDDVAEAMSAGDLDVGVFYSLYSLYHPNLITTSLLFQPNNSYFAVPQGAEREILRLIDETLAEWKADEDSFYYREVVSLLTPPQKAIPRWLVILLPVLGGTALVSGFLAWLLRKQVNRKTAELKEIHESYRATFMETDIGIVHTDPSGGILRANPMFCRYLGYSLKELEKLTIRDISHPEDLKAELPLLRELERGERTSFRLNKRYIGKDGATSWGHVSTSCNRNASGEVRYFVGVVEDITAAKEAENRLGDLESRYLGLFQNSYQATALFDDLGRIVDANDTLLNMFDASVGLETIVGKRPEEMDWLGPVISLRIQEMIEDCLSTGQIIRHTMNREETGSQFSLEVTVKPVTGPDGDIRYCIAEGYDITELLDLTENLEKQVEERTREIRETHRQLIDAEKMASLGRLVAGVTHEINTPVGVARTGISYLEEQVVDIRKRFDEGNLTQRDFTDALDSFAELSRILGENLDRAGKMLQDFKMTSVDQSSREIRSVEPKEYLNAVLQTLAPKFKSGPVEWTVDAPEQEIKLHVGAISQIVINLAVNVVSHAYGEGEPGRLMVRFASSGGRHRLEVSDDGKGIEEDHRDRIFEPFYTTGRSKGFTGLGLSIVYNLTTEVLGGTVSCRSKAGGGTTFIIDYPEPE